MLEKQKGVAHLQLNTRHKIKSSGARLPLCDRPLVQLNGQRPITWLKIITHKWSQCMPGKKTNKITQDGRTQEARFAFLR